MTSIANNFIKVAQSIDLACASAQRARESVELLAVSKTRSAEELTELYHAGQFHFGENYLQEALEKIEALQDLPLHWHFIGPIQSNKTKTIAENFSWVHSVDRLKIAQRLSNQRPDHLPALNICLQVNISEEPNKSGCSIDECPRLIAQIAALPKLKLRGLMAIPQATDDVKVQRSAFAALRQLLERVNGNENLLDTLSMGMSADLTPAIAEGATIVRVGTALFGPRNYPPKI